jgi:hypothetical protein
MAVARSRIRQKQKEQQEAAAPRKPSNPYMVIALLAGLVGLVLVIGALIFYIKKSRERAYRIKLIRGITLLDKLDDAACDYFYNEKEGRLPDEVWAPFVAEADKHNDLVDAVITRSRGAIDDFVDAARYKKGMKWGMKGRGTFYGEPRAGKYPDSGKVQVVEGHVEIGKRGARVLFFRRPITDPKTDGWYGKATIILLLDAPSPEPEPGQGLEVRPLPPKKDKTSEEKKKPADKKEEGK